MSRTLETQAEILKLGRLLGLPEGELDYLDGVAPEEIRSLREKATDSLFDTGAATLSRLGAAAKLLPSPLVASISERVFGPLLCARAAASVDPGKAIDVAKRLSPDFLADATVELDPRRVARIIAGVPTSLVEPVAAELGRRGEHVTMGRFLAFVSDDAIVAAMGALSDEAMLRTAFVLEHKEALDHAVGLLPPDRLPSVLACASEHDLWPEALDLLDHLSPATRGPIADVVAELDEDLVARLVAAVSAAGIWENLLPVVGTMTPEGRLLIASRPAFHDAAVLREIVHASATGGLWVDLVPLLRALPADGVALLPGIVTDLDHATLAAVLGQAVAAADTLVPLLDIVTDMDAAGRAKVVEVVDAADRDLGELLVAALTDPEHVRLLLDHVPADVLAAVERAADRTGLREEFDAAVAGARA
ncbi:hypothetical protein [Marmoricola sp. RAF53]|uniref:hypothetical protein n=1 Tax=Marmoricola sp. RAF53 TaxID=3233059 RepID=UPI003F9BE821